MAYLMEDATDISWQAAKVAHAVLMCKMERGTVQWENGDRIDRIRRGHARNMSPKVGKIGVGRTTKNPGSARIFRVMLVVIQRTMNQMAGCKNTYALFV